jgi:hypothetical protein
VLRLRFACLDWITFDTNRTVSLSLLLPAFLHSPFWVTVFNSRHSYYTQQGVDIQTVKARDVIWGMVVILFGNCLARL